MRVMLSVLLVFPVYAVQITGDSPTETMELLENLLAKKQKEKEAEVELFDEFSANCADFSITRKHAIATLQEEIDKLSAEMEKHQADIDLNLNEIANHEGDITAYKNDENAATKVRQMEKDEYLKENSDYSDTIDAVSRAVEVLESKTGQDVAQLFIQLAASERVPDDTKLALTKFLQQPAANAYEFGSHGIVDMLKDLKSKFNDEKNELENNEVAAQNSYDNLMNDLKERIMDSETRMNSKKEFVNEQKEQKGNKGRKVKEDTTARDINQSAKEAREATCKQTKQQFKNRQTLRAEEIEKIEEGIKIMKSKEAQGGTAAALLEPTARKMGVSFLQINIANSMQARTQKLIAFLDTKARFTKSQVIEALAVSAKANPFGKVIGMVRKLIAKLEKESAEEESEKSACDARLLDNEKVRNRKTNMVIKLHSKNDAYQANIDQLAQGISDLTESIAELDANVQKATKIRADDKAENKQKIEDAVNAQKAINNAIKVLSDFMGKAAGSTSFIQQPAGGASAVADAAANAETTGFKNEEANQKDLFGSSYAGAQDEAGGIVGMMETIAALYARIETETSQNEEQDATEFEDYLQQADTDKKAMTRNIEQKELDKQNAGQDKSLIEEDLEANSEELTEAIKEFGISKKACLVPKFSYEDRVEKREQEIQSLKEALAVFSEDNS